MPGSLAPEAVLPLLRGRFGRPYRHRTACATTQRLLGEADPEGAVATCEEQTAGRGRLGRSWHAPRGTALLASLLLRPPPARATPELSLVGGLAVAETVEAVTGLGAAVKWPNDVLLGGRKVAGVLAEQRGAVVVLGVGLNVNQRDDDLPERPSVLAGSLLLADGVHRERAPLLAELLVRLESRYDRWCAGGLADTLRDLEGRDALLGLRVTVEGVHGVAAGLAPDGRLRVETRAGTVLVAGGEASVEPPCG